MTLPGTAAILAAPRRKIINGGQDARAPGTAGHG